MARLMVQGIPAFFLLTVNPRKLLTRRLDQITFLCQQCNAREMPAAFHGGKRAATVRRYPAFLLLFLCAEFSCFHTTDCEAYSFRRMDMGSLTCAQIWVCAVRHAQVYRHAKSECNKA